MPKNNLAHIVKQVSIIAFITTFLLSINGISHSVFTVVHADEEDNMEHEQLDKSELENILEEVKEYDSEDYTEESYALLISAVAEAEEVYADEDATQEEVKGVVTAIRGAINDLDDVEVEDPEPEVDKTDLKEAIQTANAYHPDGFTEESYSFLIDAVTEAEEVDEDQGATQEEVDEATMNIHQAIDELVEADPVVDTTALEEAIQKTKGFDSDEYTFDSYFSLTSVVDEAVEVMRNGLATQEEVDEAIGKIDEAIQGLEERKEDPKPALEDPKEESENAGEGDTLPETASPMFNWMIAGLITMLAGGVVLFIHKRKQAETHRK